jgi:hypothetical protein
MVSVLALRGHWAHLMVFGIPVAALVGAVATQEIRARWGKRTNAEPGIESRPGWSERLDGPSPHLRVAAAGLLAAAAIHVVVVPEHFREYVLFGLFFSALAVAQLLLAVLVMCRPSHQLVRYIAWGSAWVIVLWMVSRTGGIPFGPEPWKPEQLGSLDAAATTAELITLVGCLNQLWTTSHRRRSPGPRLQELTQ